MLKSDTNPLRLRIRVDLCNKKETNLDCRSVVTRMDTPNYGETLKFMYIKYQPILVVLTKGLPSLILV